MLDDEYDILIQKVKQRMFAICIFPELYYIFEDYVHIEVVKIIAFFEKVAWQLDQQDLIYHRIA